MGYDFTITNFSEERAYHNTAILIYLKSVHSVFGGADVTIGNSLNQGYYSYINLGGAKLTSSDIHKIRDKMEKIIQKLQVAASEKDLQIIILYHNAISVDTNGSSFRTDDAKILEIVRKCCITNNVSFIDATEQFLVHYQETCQMPYGFANTVPGVGHLNETGHKIIAELVYQQITELTRRNPHGIQ